MPKRIRGREMMVQKLDYTHNNPVKRSGSVSDSENGKRARSEV